VLKGPAAATLYVRIAIVLVSLIADARQLGYFGVSYRMVEALLVLPTLLVGAAFPIFARANKIDLSTVTGVYRALSFMGLGLVLVAIGWFYQKVLFRRQAAPIAPATGA